MSDLSILAAAREAPDRPAIVDEQGTLTFAELAERAMALTAPSPTRAWLAPRAVRDDVARILGMLERRVGFLLAHARWTARERDAAIARVGAGAASAREQVLVLTSGSAGRPKVVRLSHEALVAAAAAHAAALPWCDGDAWLARGEAPRVARDDPRVVDGPRPRGRADPADRGRPRPRRDPPQTRHGCLGRAARDTPPGRACFAPASSRARSGS